MPGNVVDGGTVSSNNKENANELVLQRPPQGDVMRFQKQTTPPPYLNRRDQYRMLGMVLLLMFVVVAIDFTARPENWAWFFNVAGTEEEGEKYEELTLDGLDFRVKENGEPLPLETFIAQVPREEVEERLNPEMPAIDRIPADLLQDVDDRQVGLLRSEQAALAAVLERVRSLTDEELRQAARDDVGFRALNTDSADYRGELMRIDGLLWRYAPFPFGDRDDPEDDLAQAWMFTSDSGNHPWFVLLTDPPPGLEFGDQLDRPVSVAGYYFRQFGYPTETGVTLAPMLIARTLQVRPTQAAQQQRTENISYYVVGFLGIVGVLFGTMIWWFVRSDRKFARSRLAEIAESRLDAPPEAVADLNKLEAVDPLDVLRDREEET